MKPVYVKVGMRFILLMVGALLVFIIAERETRHLKEGISGGAEAQMSAGVGGEGSDPYGLYGGGSGTIVPANAAYSNIDAYPSSGQINAGGQGYAPSASSAPPHQQQWSRTDTSTDEAYHRYHLNAAAEQRAYEAGLRAAAQRRRWIWPLSLILG